MTVAELIAELQKHPPGKPVRACSRFFYWRDIEGECEQPLAVEDALPVDEVRNEGGYVIIWGGQP